MDITLNTDQRLFVIQTAHGMSSHGFDVVALQLRALVDRIKALAHLQAKAARTVVGTLEQYAVYREAVDLLQRLNIKTPTWFDPRTPLKVQRILERYRTDGGVVRIYLGDAETGRDWLDENDVIGSVGRSMGPLRVPLLIERGECGGGAIIDHCIVRLQDATTGRVLWSHERYHQPELRIVEDVWKRFRAAVTADGLVHARFDTYASAAAYVGFLTGQSLYFKDQS